MTRIALVVGPGLVAGLAFVVGCSGVEFRPDDSATGGAAGSTAASGGSPGKADSADGGSTPTPSPSPSPSPSPGPSPSPSPRSEPKPLGVECAADSDCGSGFCRDGVCCESSCDDACASCNLPGLAGTCTVDPESPDPEGICGSAGACGDQSCAAGDACVAWYEDADGDGFGDKATTAMGCASAAPVVAGTIYVSNSDDCFDGNKNAFPGQTAFFPVDRGDGSYDYDCNGEDEKKVPSVQSLKCQDCHGPTESTCSQTCSQLGIASVGFVCKLPGSCGGPKVTQGFASDVACGALAELVGCTSCAMGNYDPSSVGTTQQQCR